MVQLLANKGQGKVGDALAKNIQIGAHLVIASSLFSIYDYSVLSKQSFQDMDDFEVVAYLVIADWRMRIEVEKKKRSAISHISKASDYKDWLLTLKSRVRQVQLKAAVAVNEELLRFYWGLGADIIEKQKNTTWGMVS